MFSNLSSSSISLATVTPSLVTTGAPQDFSITTFRPLGPRVTRTVLASVSIPVRILVLASTSKTISFALMQLAPHRVRGEKVFRPGGSTVDQASSSTIPKISLSRRTRRSSPSTLISVPA